MEANEIADGVSLLLYHVYVSINWIYSLHEYVVPLAQLLKSLGKFIFQEELSFCLQDYIMLIICILRKYRRYAFFSR